MWTRRWKILGGATRCAPSVESVSASIWRHAAKTSITRQPRRAFARAIAGWDISGYHALRSLTQLKPLYCISHSSSYVVILPDNLLQVASSTQLNGTRRKRQLEPIPVAA
jgi:hypothetical protein